MSIEKLVTSKKGYFKKVPLRKINKLSKSNTLKWVTSINVPFAKKSLRKKVTSRGMRFSEWP